MAAPSITHPPFLAAAVVAASAQPELVPFPCHPSVLPYLHSCPLVDIHIAVNINRPLVEETASSVCSDGASRCSTRILEAGESTRRFVDLASSAHVQGRHQILH